MLRCCASRGTPGSSLPVSVTKRVVSNRRGFGGSLDFGQERFAIGRVHQRHALGIHGAIPYQAGALEAQTVLQLHDRLKLRCMGAE
jgi:hypothetical protein